MAGRQDLLRELGLSPIWVRRETARPGALSSQRPARTSEVPAPRSPAAPPAGRAVAALQWPELSSAIRGCTACGLCKTRTNTVQGVGDQRAEWMFVGEAPGADEDRQGEPFVGQAGRLLDNMLAAMGLKRGRTEKGGVYIANVLKCRPPGNRNPEPLEVGQCSPFLERQIELIQPKLIVALGKFAAMTLLNTDSSISQLRGRVHRCRGIPLIVTYHPAYLLRTLSDKSKAWEDLCLARATMKSLENEPAGPI